MDHDNLVKTAKDAVEALFKDKSVSARKTYEDLNQLVEEIEMMIDAIGIVDL